MCTSLDGVVLQVTLAPAGPKVRSAMPRWALVGVTSFALMVLTACGDDDSTPPSCSYKVTLSAASQDAAAFGAAPASDSGMTPNQCSAICGPGIVDCQSVGTATLPQIECTGYCM
jgi:hypothetical protein